jgi:putative photosynthetic complex assembly protein
MADPFHDTPFPRGALLAAGALLGVVLLAAAWGRISGVGVVNTPEPVVAESRELLFFDRDDGAVVVMDGGNERLVAILESGTNGFIRGVLRGMARERKSMAIGPESPFELVRTGSGELFLNDPQTGRRISLSAFGPTNAGDFARLLEADATAFSSNGLQHNDAQGG